MSTLDYRELNELRLTAKARSALMPKGHETHPQFFSNDESASATFVDKKTGDVRVVILSKSGLNWDFVQEVLSVADPDAGKSTGRPTLDAPKYAKDWSKAATAPSGCAKALAGKADDGERGDSGLKEARPIISEGLEVRVNGEVTKITGIASITGGESLLGFPASKGLKIELANGLELEVLRPGYNFSDPDVD